VAQAHRLKARQYAWPMSSSIKKEMKKPGDSKNPFEGTKDVEAPVPKSSSASSKHVDIEALREKVNSKYPLDDYTYLEMENNPEYMVLTSVVSAVVSIVIVLGAYWFVIAAGDRITPLCKPYSRPDLPIYSFTKAKAQENWCYSSTYCFWTYPILCPLAVIWVNWKNLLDKRIFYECLLNRIFLVQSRVSHVSSLSFWFLITYGLLALSTVHFMSVVQNHLEHNHYWKYKEVVFGMLSYVSAVAAFLYMLFCQWSVNAQIISLSNFVYRDTSAAVALMNEVTFVPVDDFQAAWEHVEELYETLKNDERINPDMNTPELLQLTMDMHSKYKDQETTIMDRIRGCCGIVFLPKRYWAYRLLWCEQLKDTRSWHFRFCIRFYALFMALSVAMFIWGMIYTTIHYIHFQKGLVVSGELKSLPAPHEAGDIARGAVKIIKGVVNGL